MLKLYENVMSSACHGLFYREGEAVGECLAKLCDGNDDILEHARKILIARGWVEAITFKEKEVNAHGSIEVVKGNGSETCHRLRGLISQLYQKRYRASFRFIEVECGSKGDPDCVFRLGAV